MNTNLYGICMVKNEEDIIAFCLTHAAKYCKKIFVLDNGSTDKTWERVKKLSCQNKKIIPFERKVCRYGVGLRGYVFNKVRDRFQNGDWILILDSDEFLEVDPMPYISYCERRGFDMIFTYQAQFYITPLDFEKRWYKNGFKPIESFMELPSYYFINWREPRLFRYSSSLEWPDMDTNGYPSQIDYPNGLERRSNKKIINRHYQYRSLAQIKKRLALRSNLFKTTGRFRHNQEKDFQKYIRNHKRLKKSILDQIIKPTVFDFLRLYLIRRSNRFKMIINNRTLVQKKDLR